jgi:ribosome-binding protein aMBF1 (putative translation factor)
MKMDNCALCNKQVDERETQDISLDSLELSLCLSCDSKYSDEELIELMEEEL